MTDIEERFAGNGDDGSLIERQFLSRASARRGNAHRIFGTTGGDSSVDLNLDEVLGNHCG
jgi:hypothetical protein